VAKYHSQQNSSLSNSLNSFDDALSGAVEKLDSGLGNLNILMNDFLEGIALVKKAS
jgi:exonuclease VII small subunit